MFDVHALNRPDALREREELRRAERLGRVPRAPVAIPNHGRVEAFLDGRPDREDRRERVALDAQVAAIPHMDLVDLVEQVLGGMGREDIGQARIHAHAQQRQASGAAPVLVPSELVVAKLHPRLMEWVLRMRPGEAVGHVHVVDARRQGTFEDGHHEARIDRVHHQVDAFTSREPGHRVRVASIDLLDHDPRLRGLCKARLQRAGARHVVVGQDQALAPVAGRRHAGDRLAHRADSDQQDPHASRGAQPKSWRSAKATLAGRSARRRRYHAYQASPYEIRARTR